METGLKQSAALRLGMSAKWMLIRKFLQTSSDERVLWSQEHRLYKQGVNMKALKVYEMKGS